MVWITNHFIYHLENHLSQQLWDNIESISDYTVGLDSGHILVFKIKGIHMYCVLPYGYPVVLECYEGPLNTVQLRSEVEGVPLDSHVSAYHTGHYEHLPPMRKVTHLQGYPATAERTRRRP